MEAEWHSSTKVNHVQLAHQGFGGLVRADIRGNETHIVRAPSASRR